MDRDYSKTETRKRETRTVHSSKLSATVRHRINTAKHQLDLRNQNLVEIPAEVLKIGSQLTMLLLGSNSLTSLPNDFAAKLPNLEYLDLSNNQLIVKNLPNSISSLDKLVLLDLEKNPNIQSIPRFLNNMDCIVIVNPDPDYSDIELPQLRDLGTSEEDGDEEEQEERYEVKAYLEDGTYHTDEEDYDATDDAEFNSNDEVSEEEQEEVQVNGSLDLDNEATAFFAQLANSVDASDDAESHFRNKITRGDSKLLWYLQHRFGTPKDQLTRRERQAAKHRPPLGVSRKNVDDNVAETKWRNLKNVNTSELRHDKYINKEKERIGAEGTRKDRKIKQNRQTLYDE